VSKYSGLLEQFGTYASRFNAAGMRPSKADIEEFMEKFISRTYFHMGATSWDSTLKGFRGANAINPKTGERVYELDPKKTTKENIDEMRGVLHEAFLKEYGTFGVPMDNFDPKPFVPETDDQQILHESIKEFVQKYNQSTLPFRLRKTMHHPVQAITFSGGEVRSSTVFTLQSEKEVKDYVSSTKVGSGGPPYHGGMNKGLRDIWFRPNMGGVYPKVGVIDIDNAGGMPFDEYARIVYDIAKYFSKVHATMPVFTGKSFQVWFATKPMQFETSDECWDYIYSGVKKTTSEVAFDKDAALGSGLPYVDKTVMHKDHMVGMLFGMHYKPNRDLSESEGYCRIPVDIKDIKKFNPASAHPVAVLKDFERLKGMADKWFTAAEVGDGFTDVEAAPPCKRTPSSKHDKTNPLTLRLQEWKKEPVQEVRYRFIGEEVLQHQRLVVTPKYDGQLGLLKFDKRGGFKIHGERLDRAKEAARAGMDVERCVMVFQKVGGIGWDNYLTREFERICADNDVDEITVVVESIVVDQFGRVEGNHAVTSILSKDNDGHHDPSTFRNLKAVILDVLSVDGKDVYSLPYEERLMKAADLESDRIKCLDPTVIEDDYEAKVDSIWRYEVGERMNEGLYIHGGGRRYKVKRKYTLDAVVMGIRTDTKAWLDEKPMVGSMLVGVSKSTKDGMVLVPVGFVGGGFTQEVGRELFNLVLGEPRGEEYGYYEHSVTLPGLQETYPDTHFVEPRIIVEVEYQKLSGRRTVSGPSFTRKAHRLSRGQRMGLEVTRKEYFSRSLIGPPQFLRIRYDKDMEDADDYSFRQGDAAGGFSIGLRSDPLPNPVDPDFHSSVIFTSESGLTNVIRNPFYGFNAGPRWVSGGPQPYTHPDYPGMTFGVDPSRVGPGSMAGSPLGPRQGAGATRDDKWLTMLKEFPNQHQLTEDKWGLHYAPDKFLKFPKDKNGISYYLTLPGFPLGSDDAVFDEEGPNLGGTVHDKKREEVRYHNQLLMEYMEDDDQARRDAEYAREINLDRASFQTFDQPIGDLPDSQFDGDFYVRQGEDLGNQFSRQSFDGQKDMEKHAAGLSLVKKNPEEAEGSITGEDLPKSEAGFISPFDAFMTFGDEEE
jgi:ATP-dependent DNA ligase